MYRVPALRAFAQRLHHGLGWRRRSVDSFDYIVGPQAGLQRWRIRDEVHQL